MRFKEIAIDYFSLTCILVSFDNDESKADTTYIQDNARKKLKCS